MKVQKEEKERYINLIQEPGQRNGTEFKIHLKIFIRGKREIGFLDMV